jgi:M6 family metalloprotease-like protein
MTSRSRKKGFLLDALISVLISFFSGVALGQPTDLSVKAATSGPDIQTNSQDWMDVPELVQAVETTRDGNLEMTISGEVRTAANERMFLRVLVDGSVAEPSDVLLVTQGFNGTRSFSFVKQGLTAGIHIVKVQWHSDHGDLVYFGDRTLTVTAAPNVMSTGGMMVKAAASGADRTTTSTVWSDVPDLQGSITAAAGGNLEITVSAEVNASDDKQVLLRALVDGQIADPPEVVFAKGRLTGTRSFSFVKENLSAGNHQVQVQWHTESGGTAYIGDRTLALFTSKGLDSANQLFVTAAGQGPAQMTAERDWVDVPGLDRTIATAAASALRITVSGVANVTAGKRLFLRVLVDEEAASPSDVVFVAERLHAARSATFIKENLRAGVHRVKVQWHTDEDAYGFIEQRTLTVASQRPSLWRAFTHIAHPHLTWTNPDIPQVIPRLFRDVDAVVRIPTLVVLLQYNDLAAVPTNTVAQYVDLVFGENRLSGEPSVAEILRETSNGRLLMLPATAGDTLDSASDGVVGWVTGAARAGCCWDGRDPVAGVTQPACVAAGHTWRPGSFRYFDCFIKEKRAEGILQADALFDYSLYDGNRDGVLTSDELTVIIVDTGPGIGANARQTDPGKVPVENGTLTVYQLVTGVTQATHAGVIAHELGHQVLGLEDLYAMSTTTDPTGYTHGGKHYPPDPDRYSLMGANNPRDWIQHLDPWAKIHLGFVKPLVVDKSGTYRISDAETERSFSAQLERPEAIVVFDQSRESPFDVYFILENREKDVLDPVSGNAILDKGLAVWLIDENETEARKRIQLVRRDGYFANTLRTFWDGGNPTDGYNITESSTPRNTNWADGTASRVRILNISPAANIMTLDLRIAPD